MGEIIVGIDLGTTNSEVAVVREGRVEMIPVSAEGPILPSVVGVGPGGELLVGAEAKNQAILYPERTVRSIKRRMGESGKVSLGEKDYSPQEISAMILARLKQVAESHLGQPVGKAVITVPAFFSDAQRQATREAGEIAGLEVVRILNEPTAAALAYEKRVEFARKVVVYDLGGGTFDVSVANIENGVVEILSSHGNNHLGGDDFDRRIQQRLESRVRESWGVDLSENRVALARLQRASEEVKRALSDRPFGTVSEEFLFEKDGLPVHLTLEISREEYEEMISDYIEETISCVRVALSNAGVSASEIDEILLVGGSTRTPLVARRLEEEFGRQPRSEVHPDLCVAMGAAIQAARIAGLESGQVLVDVTPYTFGTSALAESEDGELSPYVYVPLIRKNTPIPVTKSEVFYTLLDNQDAADVFIYQGENSDVRQNIEIGNFLLDGLSNRPRGNEIVLLFSLDADGILQISAREKATGLERTLTIDRQVERFGQEDLDRSRERVAALLGDDPELPQLSSDKAPRTADLRARAEALLPELSGEDKEDLSARVADLLAAVEDGTEEEFVAAVEAIEDLLFYLES
ncbi:MAG: Hsp70 family protein [Leptospirillia bacterium]